MITRDWKIDRLLNDYPQALEVLVSASPHFKKLQNKFLRKALAPRVTIEQAAEIGGLEVDELLAKLNAVAGFAYRKGMDLSHENGKSADRDGQQLTHRVFENLASRREVVLDVRPLIQSGTDPLKVILTAARRLHDDEILHLINSFEPVPLYSVLEDKGFDHVTRQMDGAWNVYFYRPHGTQEVAAEELAAKSGTPSDEELDQSEVERVIELDVRGLEPPEPMMRILEKLAEVDDRTILLVHHHREPMMLYEKLSQRGYHATTNRISENYYKVVIRKVVSHKST